MDRRISASIVVQPQNIKASLLPLAGRWQSGVSVRITRPHYTTKGSVHSITNGQVIEEHPGPSIEPVKLYS